jgi:transposase
MVVEHGHEYPTEWAAIASVAGKLGMTPETLRKWLRRDQVDSGRRPGVTTSERERLRQLEREVRELRRANEILKAASVFFAGELDPRRSKP